MSSRVKNAVPVSQSRMAITGDVRRERKVVTKINHGMSVGDYQRCLKRTPGGSCQKCKDFVAEYQRNQVKKKITTAPERDSTMASIVRIVKYVFECDGCHREVNATESSPTEGVVGEITFPNSAYGQRRTYAFYSCKEDATHVAKAMRTAVAKREENVRQRKSSGEEYSRKPNGEEKETQE